MLLKCEVCKEEFRSKRCCVLGCDKEAKCLVHNINDPHYFFCEECLEELFGSSYDNTLKKEVKDDTSK